MKKISAWKTKGMNRDLSVSAFNPEFSFENKNLRLSTNEGNTLLSWVNEKSTASIQFYIDGGETAQTQLPGIVIGAAVLNEYLVLFVKGEGTYDDCIFKLKYRNGVSLKMDATLLYKGKLGFDITKPLETAVSYEQETVQKVYWTDGEKQPRVINIYKTYGTHSSIDDDNYNPFDFVPVLRLEETVSVTKLLGASGMFAPGVIQYALTYYDKYGQESNIFYTSPLLYISHRDRGGSPEDKVDNAFKIEIANVDPNFDFIRIYSIQRTSLNGVPMCKRVQDIDLRGFNQINPTVSYIDTGFSGETIDPTELLYKGGEVISAETMEQKDGTMFFGGIKIERNTLSSYKTDIEAISVTTGTREIYPIKISGDNYKYSSQLTAYDAYPSGNNSYKSVPCGGFKRGDYYRCGLQFQHESGKWSDPFYINKSTTYNDVRQTGAPSCYIDPAGDAKITLPIFKAVVPNSLIPILRSAGYRKVRPVVVFPDIQDRETICQAVVCPTLYTVNHRSTDKDLYAQASWFFRTDLYGSAVSSTKGVAPAGSGTLPYTSKSATYDPATLRQVEIWGDYDTNNKFQIDRTFLTLHSPDIEFDDRMWLVDYGKAKYRKVGTILFERTLSDIEIQTSTPTISNAGSGFEHRTSADNGLHGIISGPYYDDFIIDDRDKDGDLDTLRSYKEEQVPVKWYVNLWHKNGSLNNDINRPVNMGTQTAVLKKKVVSNLRYAETTFDSVSYAISALDFYYETLPGLQSETYISRSTPQLFSSTYVSIVKVMDMIYEGNIDTLLMPDNTDGNYFVMGTGATSVKSNVSAKFTDDNNWKTFAESTSDGGCWHYGNSTWTNPDTDVKIGDFYADLAMKKEGVRMKYKSSPHLVCRVMGSDNGLSWNTNSLSIIDIERGDDATNTRFGGKSMDALKENIWIPCGEPVILEEVTGEDGVVVKYEYGDTYFQRWDCLKTYPFTKEDPNQVVEIGSFMLETRVNIDGRYDRNRGQMNNLNMSPENFNLFNPVYSQTDNFFSYRMQDSDYYSNVNFPNQIVWSKQKTSGAEIDLWTNVTLASSLELDGDKGKVTALRRLNNQLLCFQDKGISQILYNDNVQISSTDGVPIEIANSGKVMGKKYITDIVGCSNKWSICNTPSGIYFMDSNEQSIYLLGEGLKNLSSQMGFNAWCKKNIPEGTWKWAPGFPGNNGLSAFRTVYDKINQDVLFINNRTALAWNEKFGVFTSFYDYYQTPFFCNLENKGVWIKANGSLYEHRSGNGYCNFFGTNKPYWMTLVGNPEPQMDKIFTNMEFRACVEGDGELSQSTGRFTFTLPFNSLETWNEYQHGYTTIENKSGHSAMVHNFASSSLKRKFRIWRCDIPRNNTVLDANRQQGTTYPYSTDAALGISRYIVKPNDRMRNPWLYLKLFKAAAQTGTLPKVEIHDLVMTYFD